MKLKTNTSSLLVLYVCSWPGLEDRSSGPGSIVSRSLSRGEFVSLSSKHVGFFFAREKSLQMKAIIERERRSIRTDGGRSDAPTTVVGRVRTHLHSSLSLSLVRACVRVCGSRDTRRSPVVEPGRGEDFDVSRPRVCVVTPPFCVLC